MLAFMEVCAGGGGGDGGGLGRSRGELFPTFLSNYFPKRKSAILKTNFGANHGLIVYQPYYDDFNSITGIFER